MALIFLLLPPLFFTCGCSKSQEAITFNSDSSELYYNGFTYTNYQNSSKKYRFEPREDTDHWTMLGTAPYLLGTQTQYYGDKADAPALIAANRANGFYVRKDISVDNTSLLRVSEPGVSYKFRISEVTTGNSLGYSPFDMNRFTGLCNFLVVLDEYPGVEMWITVSEYDGKLWLQDVPTSDYYEITEDFKNDLCRLGLTETDHSSKNAEVEQYFKTQD